MPTLDQHLKESGLRDAFYIGRAEIDQLVDPNGIEGRFTNNVIIFLRRNPDRIADLLLEGGYHYTGNNISGGYSFEREGIRVHVDGPIGIECYLLTLSDEGKRELDRTTRGHSATVTLTHALPVVSYGSRELAEAFASVVRDIKRYDPILVMSIGLDTAATRAA